ncbi:MAG: hypothetical protein ACTHMS_00280 [Jatrophihabitans sp.]|uniref:hypothetical protein n=1 Tax=Jatrophihabitans sp. TaxID=1932789 RepID=UPI003F7D8043
MADIEFLTPDVAERPTPEDATTGVDPAGGAVRPGWTRVVAALAGPVLLLVAAAVAVKATFGAVYELRSSDSSGASGIGTFHVDGWGRYHATRSSLVFTGHADRYGLVAVVAAGLLVLAALVAAGAALRPTPGRTPAVAAVVAGAAALLGAGALAAVGGVGWIRAGTERDALAAAVERGEPGTVSITVDSGGFVWLCVVAAGFAAVGVVLAAVVAARARGTAAAWPDAPTPHPAPPAARDDRAPLDATASSGVADDDPFGDEELLGR